jgi:hypothetical protein
MNRPIAVVLILMSVSGESAAVTCSSLDGQKYCSCSYNQECLSKASDCECGAVTESPRPPRQASPSLSLPMNHEEPAANTVSQRSTQKPVQTSRPSQDEAIKASPSIASDDDIRSARDYVQLAKAEIGKGRTQEAIELIDKGQTRLLDRSVVLNHTFDPITDESIKYLTGAKRSLLASDRVKALEFLDSALTSIQ